MGTPAAPRAAPPPKQGGAMAARQPIAGGDATRSDAAGTACIPSERLFAGAVELHIDHRGAIYRLKQTALGKLILTK